VLEKYLIPGGSAAHFKRDGYTFDVGSSMMFGFGDKGTTNLITKALESVGRRMETVPDPTQVHYHLPKSAAHPEVRSSHRVVVWARCTGSAVGGGRTGRLCCSSAAARTWHAGRWPLCYLMFPLARPRPQPPCQTHTPRHATPPRPTPPRP
jgi:phytoene dehydrogenase-like protein